MLQVWFQNRRAKRKRLSQVKSSMECLYEKSQETEASEEEMTNHKRENDISRETQFAYTPKSQETEASEVEMTNHKRENDISRETQFAYTPTFTRYIDLNRYSNHAVLPSFSYMPVFVYSPRAGNNHRLHELTI